MSYYYPKPIRAGEPDATIDLHGYTTLQASRILEENLQDYAGHHVRLIVGKGNNSPDGPVLRTFVENFLRAHEVHFTYAHPRDGGAGALDVYFK